VIVSDDDGRLYLMSNSGVISAEAEHANMRDAVNELSHMKHSESSTHELESLRSALHKVRSETDRLEHELLHQDNALETVRIELTITQAELQKLCEH